MLAYWLNVYGLAACFLFCAYRGEAVPTPEKRIYALMTLQDYGTACREASALLEDHPSSQPLWEAYIQALAKSGDEKQMTKAWDQYLSQFPEQKTQRSLLEAMAWGVIEKGATSSSPVIRLCSVLAAALGEDARGVKLLQRLLHDPNALIRAVTLELVSQMRDAVLQKAVWKRVEKEKHFLARLELIKALGKMKIVEAQTFLEDLVADERSSAEEKAAAIQSLVYLLENPQKREIAALAESMRSGLREAACAVVAHTGETEHLEVIVPLLQDHAADVRCAAVQVLGLLQVKEWENRSIEDLIVPLLEDPHFHVAIAAAWLVTLHDPAKGQQAMKKWLNHSDRDIRLLASAALAGTGKYGFPLIQECFNASEDRYQKLNLALGLIGQQREYREACRAIYTCFVEEKERWMWDQQGPFRFIAPCHGKRKTITHHPEVINQLVRLEILNILAIIGDPHAQPAIQHFLQERNWEVWGHAAALLLTEGDETALTLVKDLLEDAHQKTRIQAALILALWGKEEGVVQILQEAYPHADRELKERILEGMGHIGIQSSIPFLTEQLKESFQSLRIIAAASLLQCLYH